MVKLDSMELECINKVREQLLKLTNSPPSVIIEEDGLTIEAYFRVPTKETPEALVVERQKRFEELLRAISFDYLFSGIAQRITIEVKRDIGLLLIEFRPIHKIVDVRTLHQ
jgi:tetrahydromethanopterin S-methyltransferase subunit G